MKLGWYKRQVSPTEYGFYYINGIGRYLYGICIWPDEERFTILNNLSRYNFENNFLSNNDGYEPDTVFYDDNFNNGLIKLVFSEYIDISDVLDKIIEWNNETL